MKILYGTKNPAKVNLMKQYVDGLDLEIVSLNDIDAEIPAVEETGDTPLENAQIKATAYYKAFGMPVFSCDSGLYFENLPQFSPKVHVRTVNGKYLSDEEMVEYYSGLSAKYGDIIAQYQNAICLVVDDEHIYSQSTPDMHGGRFIITSVPHPKRVKGFPLDCISKEISSGKYYYDSYDSPQETEKNYRPGFFKFFEEILF